MFRTIPGLAAAFAAVGLLAACDTPTTKTERALVGAGAGAIAAEIVDGSPVTGAVVGGAAGYFCDDLGVCRRR